MVWRLPLKSSVLPAWSCMWLCWAPAWTTMKAFSCFCRRWNAVSGLLWSQLGLSWHGSTCTDMWQRPMPALTWLSGLNAGDPEDCDWHHPCHWHELPLQPDHWIQNPHGLFPQEPRRQDAAGQDHPACSWPVESHPAICHQLLHIPERPCGVQVRPLYIIAKSWWVRMTVTAFTSLIHGGCDCLQIERCMHRWQLISAINADYVCCMQ